MRLANTPAWPLGGVESLPEDGLAQLLAEARRRTLALVEPLSGEQIDRQHSPLMSPLAWDLGHIAAFADLWSSRAVPGLEPLHPDLFEVYDATETPRPRRGDLPYLRREEAIAYGHAVLERSLAALERLDVSAGGDRLNAYGFVWHMIAQHEHQHNETMVQAMQLADGAMPAPLDGGGLGAPRADPPRPPASGETSRDGADGVPGGAATFPGARVPVGARGERFAYDNERPEHEVELAAFELDATPVTNAQYRAWIEAGGYRRREWWSPAGWAWREREGAERPLYWTADGRARRFDRLVELDPHRPVSHVSWFEADAFARAHGKRLPTELEWEAVATWDPATARKRRFPWGDEPPAPERANLDLAAGGPGEPPPAGTAPSGARGLVGDVWEWTASELRGYPGFTGFPYREYSEIFFGPDYKVLRGGSWATRPGVIRNTFRNWDYPRRRQIFCGFRCAAS